MVRFVDSASILDCNNAFAVNLAEISEDNPIKEHEINVLDRLDQERSIGRGAGFSKRPLKGYTINIKL